ncbi:c-type cytochrome [Emticicia sp. TH156]|uniref:c-type cytochrome n=1 Tax=Emticicia sp. TH156 TaxID=2067454 RepID=UPI0026CC404F|nr:c-type cytochrome [Emticicia sp. TH156]
MIYTQKTIIKLVFPLIGGIILKVGYHTGDSTVKSGKPAAVFTNTQMFSDTTPDTFGFGRKASQADIDRLDIDIRPDGKGLPAGAGIAVRGKLIFDNKCAACHGTGGVGGPNGSLVTSKTPANGRKEKTIGNYWPYATTVFDYIRRAMPFNAPGSLSNEEVYHLTAYLLNANQIIDEKTVINDQNLSKIEMPARKLFIPDDRKGGAEIR